MTPIGAARPRASHLLRQSFANTPSQATPVAPRASPPPRQPLLPPPSKASFSTTAPLERRRIKFRDNNPNRGVSTIYRSGPREFLSVSDDPIPVPRRVDELKEAAKRVDPNHGLWKFFYDKRPSNTPLESSQHGRPWTVEELRQKSWDDLHRLWWVCCMERNRIATAVNMRRHHKMGFGDEEGRRRETIVLKTQQGIKHALTERWYAWEDAYELAKTDSEIDLSGKGDAFTPKEFLESQAEAAMEDEAAQKAFLEGEAAGGEKKADIDLSAIPPPPGPPAARDDGKNAKV